MSLLTNQTKEQRFYQKMQAQYNKKSFNNSNYIEPQHPLNIINDNTQKFEEMIQENIDLFLSNLKNIISNAKNSRIDYYYILNFMKNTDFFNQMSQLINQDIIHKYMKIQKENKQFKEQIKKSHQKIRQFQRDRSPKIHQKAKTLYHKFNGIKTISQNLYAKAKIMTEAEFSDLCNKVILNQKVVIKKITDSSIYNKVQNGKIDKVEERHILKKIDDYLQHFNGDNLSEAEKQFNFLLAQLKKNREEGEKHFPSCKRPCCSQYIQSLPFQVTKAQSLRKSCQARKEPNIYKNDKAQQYFNRYYRRSSFDRQKIINVEKTKMEQMQKLQDIYRISLKNRRKNASNFSHR